LRDLVMIPAFGCDERLFRDIVPVLDEFVRPRTIIATASTFADCVAQVLETAPRHFIVLGISFGGRVALETALAAPERVEGLVVIGAGPGAHPDIAKGLQRSRRLRSGEMEGVLADMGAMIAHLPGERGPATRDLFIRMGRDMGPETMARQSDSLAHRSDLTPRLSTIACPALMLWGAHDQFVSTADGLALSAAIPRARYTEIASVGHFPSLEAPEETVAILAHWLADAGLTSGS
jgi:pimeloyl-ACP methyl ester carboxylesterase